MEKGEPVVETTIREISSFSGVGVWKSYKADGDNSDFGKRSIIYGFNGSGKTTLSRIFQSLEQEELSPKLGENAKFKIQFSNGTTASENDLSSESISAR